MNSLDIRHHHLRNENARLMARLVAALPSATLEMETLAKLAGIVTDRTIPTAAMECKHRPRLLLNPDFVDKYCGRDEHLLLLVMHELWHVVLAHTSLYPRMTKAQNIAFDAIINANLLNRFNSPAYIGFFDRLYPADVFPHLLLRPPVGWPNNPQYPENIGPKGTHRILTQLYPRSRLRFPPQQTFYVEILNLLRKDIRERGLNPESLPFLIGDHRPLDAHNQGLVGEYLQNILSESGLMPWGRGWGNNLSTYNSNISEASQEARRIFAKLLFRIVGVKSRETQRTQIEIKDTIGRGVIPNPHDRVTYARQILGIQNTIYNQEDQMNVWTRRPQPIVYVYFDVSGSMRQTIPYLINLLIPYVKKNQVKLFQFSTVVKPVRIRDFKNGAVISTGGTHITPVLDHFLQSPLHIPAILLLTDGLTGQPQQEHIVQIRNRKIKIHVVLPARSAHITDLESIATTFTVLPKL